jgi:tetratricopeptide (TPR) repeat protein
VGTKKGWWKRISATERGALIQGIAAVVAALVGIIGILLALRSPSAPPTHLTPSPHVAPPSTVAPTLLTSTPSTDSSEYFFSRGLFFFEQGEYPRAIENYTLAIAKQRDYAEAYLERGRTYIRLSDFDKAMEDLTESLFLRPDDCRGYSERGNVYYNNLQDYLRAAADYTKLIELCPDATAYEFRGDAYFYQGKHREAITDYTETLTLDPERVGAYVRRGSSYEQIGELELAIMDYERALALRPDDDFVRQSLQRLTEQ